MKREIWNYLLQSPMKHHPKIARFDKKIAMPILKMLILLRNEDGMRDIVKSIRRKKDVGWFPYFEIVITKRCSLRCRHCAALMQYYEKPYDVPLNTILASIDRLMQLCDKVDHFRILGGEPFLYKDFSAVLEKLLSYPQIRVVGVATNGTVPIRDENLLTLLKNERVWVDVSDYGFEKVDAFCRCMEENGIRYIRTKNKTWYDFGGINRRERSGKALKRQFKSCSVICPSIQNGKLYYCGRTGHLNDLGVPENPNDCLDLLNEEHAVSKRELIDFYYHKKGVAACDYCDFGTPGGARTISAGKEQLKKPLAAE